MSLMERFKVPKNYEIPEEDDARLRSILAMTPKPGEEPKPLPETLIACYYAMKRSLDILGTQFTDWQVATVVCIAAAFAKANPEMVPSVPKLDFRMEVTLRKTPEGALVALLWLGEWIPAYFCGFVKDEVIVQAAGSERFVAMNLVRHIEEGEFPFVKQNLNDLD